jgi:syntaxin-binding protein 1
MERLATQRNLKALSTQRILKDMIQDTKNIVEAGFLIIVVDDYTVKILSSFLTMTEVLNEGIFSIERLQTKRQAYPKYDALYFISPTNESCELLAKDFENEKKPMYRRIHIYFSHEIMDIVLEKIVTPGVVKRTKTCKELNLSFLIKDKNLFDIGLPGALKLFTVKNNTENRDRLLSCVKERLASVCAVLRENPHIQYQGNSKIASRLGEYMNAHLSEFFNTRTCNEKRGILLIVDRTIDISSPLLHDYNYETMIYDLFTTKDNELEFNEKKYKLDEKDELWMKYKNKHMCQVFEELQRDFDAFMQNDYNKVNKSEEQSFDEMANVLRDMKGYKHKTALFTLHLKLAEEITNVIKIFII